MSQHEWIDEYAAEHGLDDEQRELLRGISRELVKHVARAVVRQLCMKASVAGLLSDDLRAATEPE